MKQILRDWEELVFKFILNISKLVKNGEHFEFWLVFKLKMMVFTFLDIFQGFWILQFLDAILNAS